ncbi:MAG TPA: glutamyl-tRNA reductase [Miltoncostaeaceae bacterium]|nr:glutamyl-tRNA reductase [Miltoncostaeaceae bacterium]
MRRRPLRPADAAEGAGLDRIAMPPRTDTALLVQGLSHRTAPVEQREKAALSEAGTRALLRELVAFEPVSEAVALSTCNRTEIYVASSDPARAEEAVAGALVAHSAIGLGELACARYLLREDRAAAQIFRVAAGLDSMVVGESEIQGQVRAAWRIAAEEGSSGPVLDRLFRQALEVGKRVRSATRIGAGPASVAAAAVDLARQAVGDLADRRVLVLGAGRMAEGTALALVQRGAREVVVVSRGIAAARELGARFGGRGAGFDRLTEELAGADIVIASTGAPHPVLRPAQVAPAMSSRPGRPMAVVDIAVPRDVDAGVAGIAGVALFDIDDLERVVELNLNGRRLEARRAEDHVGRAARAFDSWRRGRQAAPAIAALRARAEEIRRAELDRVQDQWDAVSEADRQRLEALTVRIVNKLLHEPTVRLRAAAEAGDDGP